MKETLQRMGERILRRTKKYFRRIQKRIKVRFLRFLRWKWGIPLIASLILGITVVISSMTAYSFGRSFAMERAGQREEKLTARYRKEAEELRKQLKEAQIQNPEVRPWYLTLVNGTHPMEEGYVPKLAALNSEDSVDERILESLKQMLRDAGKAGLHMSVCSAYRSVDKQRELYERYMGNAIRAGKSYWQAFEETGRSTAYPGKSEHGMGLAVDIISDAYTGLDAKQQETPEAKWLAENCYKYGFILRYPPNKTEITGIVYEPWHYRYVGIEDATKITQMGVTLEEYLGEVD